MPFKFTLTYNICHLKTAYCVPQPLLGTLVSYLTLTSPFLIRSLLYLGHVSIIFVISAESVQFSISVQHMP